MAQFTFLLITLSVFFVMSDGHVLLMKKIKKIMKEQGMDKTQVIVVRQPVPVHPHEYMMMHGPNGMMGVQPGYGYGGNAAGATGRMGYGMNQAYGNGMFGGMNNGINRMSNGMNGMGYGMNGMGYGMNGMGYGMNRMGYSMNGMNGMVGGGMGYGTNGMLGRMGYGMNYGVNPGDLSGAQTFHFPINVQAPAETAQQAVNGNNMAPGASSLTHRMEQSNVVQNYVLARQQPIA